MPHIVLEGSPHPPPQRELTTRSPLKRKHFIEQNQISFRFVTDFFAASLINPLPPNGKEGRA
jgi:hypothetical protein